MKQQITPHKRFFRLVGGFCFYSSLLFSQVSIGPTVDFAYGDIYSTSLQKNLDAQRISDPAINNWTSASKFGLGTGFGAFLDWQFHSRFHLLTGLKFNNQHSGFDFNYQRGHLNGAGIGNFVTVSSQFKFSDWYFHIPLLLRYSFNADGDGAYIVGGPGLSLISSTMFLSNETRTVDHYDGFALSSRTVEYSSLSAGMDGYGTARLDFTLGGGYQFNAGGYPLLVDLRVHLPLTKTGFYTTDVFYQSNAFENGSLFGANGKTNAESVAPQYMLNDFRAFGLELSLSYALFSKQKNGNLKAPEPAVDQ